MKLTKKFRIKTIDTDAKGEVTAVIATLNVKDHDGDVTVKGAFGEQVAMIVPTHDWNSVPLGRAVIGEKGDDVIAKMRFNLDIDEGRKWYSAIKFDFDAGNPLQEYSYGYEIKNADKGDFKGERVQFLKELRVIEVSPVLLGAGIDTGTVAVKKRGRKAWAELAGSWEAIQRTLRSAAGVALNDPYCYLEATLDDSIVVVSMNWTGIEWKDSYYQFDWTMSEDGSVSLSNQREVQLDLVVSVKGITYADQFEIAVGELKHLHRRSKALAALREKEGRALSRANWERLSTLHTDLGAFLMETSPESDIEADKQLAAFLDTMTKVARQFKLVKEQSNDSEI
jgi:hypothetical protein